MKTINKNELLDTLIEIYPLTDDNKYYIFKNKYIYPSVILRPDDINCEKEIFPEISQKLFQEHFQTDYSNITIRQSNGVGGSTEEILLSELLNIEIDTSNYVEVYIKHVFDCVPKFTTTETTFKCHPNHIDEEIKNYTRDMRIKFDLHYEEPAILLEKVIKS